MHTLSSQKTSVFLSPASSGITPEFARSLIASVCESTLSFCNHAYVGLSLRYSRLTRYSYAHYHTGTVAEPPISYNGKAMGGNRAKTMIGNIGQREEELDLRSAEVYDAEQRLATAQADLRERTNAVTVREQQMQQREQALLENRNALSTHDQANHEREQAFAVFEEETLRQLEGHYNDIASTVSQMRRAVGNAQRILTNRRQQVLYHENLPNAMQDTHGQGDCERLSRPGRIDCLHVRQVDMVVLLLSTAPSVH